MTRLLKQSPGDLAFDLVSRFLITLFLLIVLYPLIFSVSASLSNPRFVWQGQAWLLPKEFTLVAYERVFRDPDIMTGYRNTIYYTVVGTTLNVFMTVMAAYPLSRKDFVGRNFVALFFAFTMFFSGGLIPRYLVVKNLGLLNTVWAMIVPNAVSVWNIIITRTYFETSIPLEIQESAMLDGCSNLKLLRLIVLPLSKPILAVITLFYAVGHWNAWFNALIYISKRTLYPLQLVIRGILVQGQLSQEMMEADTETIAERVMLAETIKYAVVIVASVPMLILYPFVQRYFVKGVMIGAVKG